MNHFPQDEEGGIVKESLLGIAQAKRAASRKKKRGGDGGGGEDDDEDDTDMPADIDRFEEKLEVEEEGGIKFMPFSLAGESSGTPLFLLPTSILLKPIPCTSR